MSFLLKIFYKKDIENPRINFQFVIFQAFLELTSKLPPRLTEKDTDVVAYVVNDVPYLARLPSPY